MKKEVRGSRMGDQYMEDSNETTHKAIDWIRKLNKNKQERARREGYLGQ